MQPKGLNRVFNPEMLTLARQSRSLTQSELAKRADVTQGWISKLENGLASEPTLERVEALGRALRYPVEFFYRGETMIGLPPSFTRRFSRLPAGVFERLNALVNIWRINIAVLLRAADLESRFEIPRMDIEEYGGDTGEIARLVRGAWLLPRGPIRNLINVLEDAGVILVPCDFGVRDLDAIAQSLPGMPPLVFYNVNAPPDRLRFTLAHELGHFVMHRTPSSEMEGQAHAFAAEFLMPANEIKTYFTSGVTVSTLAALKPIWRVSMAALLRRASDVGSISASHYKRVNSHLSKSGYKRREPPELDIAGESPTILKDLFTLHTGRLGYTDDEMIQLFSIDADDYRNTYMLDRPRLRLVAS